MAAYYLDMKTLKERFRILLSLNKCNKFPPLKLVYKHILAGYIKFFTELNSRVVSSQSNY